MVEQQELSIDGSGSGDAADDSKIQITNGTGTGGATDTGGSDDGVNAQSTLLRCDDGDESAGLLGREGKKSGKWRERSIPSLQGTCNVTRRVNVTAKRASCVWAGAHSERQSSRLRVYRGHVGTRTPSHGLWSKGKRSLAFAL